jgi:hypothetical protein
MLETFAIIADFKFENKGFMVEEMGKEGQFPSQ